MADDEQKPGPRQKLKAGIEKLFARIGKLTKVQRLLICVGVFALMGGGYYYFFYAPKAEVLTQAQEELKLAEDKLTTYKIKARSLKRVEKKMAAVQAEFDQAMKALPDKKELPSLLVGISKAGGGAGLAFELFQPEPVVDKEFYKEIPLSMIVIGAYHQVADFFFQVANLSRIVNIKDLSMAIDAKNKGKVKMKCSAVTYMFSETPPDPKNPKGRKGKK